MSIDLPCRFLRCIPPRRNPENAVRARCPHCCRYFRLRLPSRPPRLHRRRCRPDSFSDRFVDDERRQHQHCVFPEDKVIRQRHAIVLELTYSAALTLNKERNRFGWQDCSWGTSKQDDVQAALATANALQCLNKICAMGIFTSETKQTINWVWLVFDEQSEGELETRRCTIKYLMNFLPAIDIDRELKNSRVVAKCLNAFILDRSRKSTWISRHLRNKKRRSRSIWGRTSVRSLTIHSRIVRWSLTVHWDDSSLIATRVRWNPHRFSCCRETVGSVSGADRRI